MTPTDTTKAIARAILGEMQSALPYDVTHMHIAADSRDWKLALKYAAAAEKALAAVVGEDEGLLAALLDEADGLLCSDGGPPGLILLKLREAQSLASRLRSRPDSGRTKDEDKSSEKGSV